MEVFKLEVKLYDDPNYSIYGNKSLIVGSNLIGILQYGARVSDYEYPYDEIPITNYNLNTNSINLEITYGVFNSQEYMKKINSSSYSVNFDLYVTVNGEVLINHEVISGTYSSDIVRKVTKTITCNEDGSIPNITIYGSISDSNIDEENTCVYYVNKIANGHIKVNNTWKNAWCHIKKSGTWKKCLIWKKINGSWKKGV